MEENKYLIIGNEYSIFDFNLNKQFSTVKKIIVSNEIILDSFENSNVAELFEIISKSDSSNYEEIIENSNLNSIFETNLNKEFYAIIQEKLNLLTNEISNVKLNNYNFMNSISNDKFNITIRALGFSKTIYYEEKGKILSIIKKLIKDYINSKNIIFNLSQIKKFQIEIYKSEEEYKHIFLKKDSNSIILSSTFGFENNSPINFQIGSEIYFSIGDDFNFYKNSQNYAILKEHAKLENKEINLQEKILSNDELIIINKTTKDMQDMLIEMYINDKGKLRILNVSILENNIYNKSEKGFLINKSKNNYDKISLITIRDSIEDESINPKYLILRNESEIKEFLNQINICKKIDGIIFICNFYNPILDYIGKKLNIDIIYYNKELKKSLEVKLDRENINIETGEEENSNNLNPFSNILEDKNKIKDEFLEKLKNIDLNSSNFNSNSMSNNSFNNAEKEKISNVAEGIISSKNSSINKSNSNTFANMGNSTSIGKKTAMQILAEAALKTKPEKKIINEENLNLNNNSQIDFSKSEMIMENVKPENLKKINEENLNLGKFTQKIENKTEILETKIITIPKINSGRYFTDQNSISQVTGGEIYYLTTDTNNLSNPNLNFVVPISIKPIVSNTYLLINSIEEFFLIDKTLENKYFISLSNIEENIKMSFIENLILKLNKINLIISKEDIELILIFKNNIENLFIKDLEDTNEYEIIKNKINKDQNSQIQTKNDNNNISNNFSLNNI